MITDRQAAEQGTVAEVAMMTKGEQMDWVDWMISEWRYHQARYKRYLAMTIVCSIVSLLLLWVSVYYLFCGF